MVVKPVRRRTLRSRVVAGDNTSVDHAEMTAPLETSIKKLELVEVRVNQSLSKLVSHSTGTCDLPGVTNAYPGKTTCNRVKIFKVILNRCCTLNII